MTTKISTQSIAAPRLLNRRRARHTLAPLALYAVVLVLALITYSQTGNAGWAAGWLVVTWGLILAYELTGRDSLVLRGYYWLLELVGRRPSVPFDPDRAHQVYNNYPSHPPQGDVRVQWAVSIGLLLSVWVYAIYIGRIAHIDSEVNRALTVSFLLLLGVLPFAATFVSPQTYNTRYGEAICIFIIALAGVFTAISLQELFADAADWILMAGLTLVIYFFVYASQRMWGGERAVNSVVYQLSDELLLKPRSGAAAQDAARGDAARGDAAHLDVYDKVADVLHHNLRYERTFILLPSADRQRLKVRYARPGGPIGRSVLEKTVDVGASISGRAYAKKEPIVFNRVKDCPYRVELGLSDTQSEIAVPITHENEVYGVINVQSTRPDVFEPEDTHTLQIIAGILGAAMAVDRRKALYDNMGELWDQLAEATRADMKNEARAFELITDCACDALEASAFVYYPLTLSGWPRQTPLTTGIDQPIGPPRLDDNSDPLLELISTWVHCDLQAHDAAALATAGIRLPEFVTDNGFQSVFFVPIGRRQEKLGGLFVCYRAEREFGPMSVLAILSLAQAMGELMAELRYRDIYSDGFGRPDFALHVLADRFRRKNSSFRDWAMLLLSQRNHDPNCPLLEIADNSDDLFQAIERLRSSAPPGFWDSSLEAELKSYSKSLSKGGDLVSPLTSTIDPYIEQESPWVRLALYRVIVEATNNAIEHGKSKEVQARVCRRHRSIDVEITNQGEQPPSYVRPDPTPNGIYHLLKMCRDQLGATTTPPTHHDGVTRVAVSFPALPIVVPVIRPARNEEETEHEQ